MRYEWPGVEERKRVNIVRTMLQVVEKVMARVTRWWAGRGNSALTQPTSSHETCLPSFLYRWIAYRSRNVMNEATASKHNEAAPTKPPSSRFRNSRKTKKSQPTIAVTACALIINVDVIRKFASSCERLPNGLRYLRWGRDGEAVQPGKW